MMRGFLLVLLQGIISGGGVFPSAANAAPTVTLTADPVSGISPLSVTLTWSSTGASSCTASGGWTGVKAVSGSEVKTGLIANRTYTLTCSEGSGTAVATWVAPTLNTDGSALTNLAGFKLYYAPTTEGVPAATPVMINDKLATTYTVTGLTTGTWYFGMKAFNTAGIDSDMSGLANKTIALASASASVSVTVSTKPQPPVVTVAQVAYEIKRTRLGTYLGRSVGAVELGVPCGGRILQDGSRTYHEVPLDVVSLNRMPRSAIVVAQCAAG